VGVVFHHAQNRRLDPHASAWVGSLIQSFSSCVLLFLAISGWLHALSQARTPKSFAAFAGSRVRRLLVPFVLIVCAYAAIWRLIQRAGVMPLNGHLPESFLGMLAASLWPVADRAVAEQLYFLPLLFLLSLAAQALLCSAGRWAVAVACAGALIAGTLVFPHASTTGFNPSVAVWGGFAYGAGFLLFEQRERRSLPWLGLGFGIALGAVLGWDGVARAVPVVLLCAAHALPWPRLAWADRVGEASGTIFAYHTPFLLQPLMIAVAKLPGWPMQLVAVLLAAATVIGMLTRVHHELKDTRLGILLL
jgi:acyltransferase